MNKITIEFINDRIEFKPVITVTGEYFNEDKFSYYIQNDSGFWVIPKRLTTSIKRG